MGNTTTKFLGVVSPVPKGDWQNNVAYKILNLVRYNTASYIAKKDVPPNIIPTNEEYWQLLAYDSFKDKDFKTINGQSIIGEGNIEIEGGGEAITVDDQLSSTSTNPVQNKVVFGAVEQAQNTANAAAEVAGNAFMTAGNNALEIPKAEQRAKEYADEKAQTAIVTAENNAKEYTNQKVTELEQVVDNAETNANSYTDEQIAEVDLELSGKVDKVAGNGLVRAYVVEADGKQSTKQIASSAGSATTGAIVMFFDASTTGQGSTEPNGTIVVAMPRKDYHPAPKKYVDDALANAGKMYMHKVRLTAYEYLDEYWNNTIEGTFILTIISSKSTEYVLEDFTIYMQPIIFVEGNTYNTSTDQTSFCCSTTIQISETGVYMEPTVSGESISIHTDGQYGGYMNITDEITEL